MVHFNVNLTCFAINSRLYLFAITRIFCKVWLKLITLLYSATIANNILWYFFHLFELSRDVEFNPGTKPDSRQRFLICHWNLNSMSAHNYYSKILLLTPYIFIQNYFHTNYFDKICLSETYVMSVYHRY